MKIWTTKTFRKWQKKSKISNYQLSYAISEMLKGLIDSDLGNGLYKKRIARAGEGKRSGYRTLIASNKNNKWFFIYGFAKNERENIDPYEEKVLKRLAEELLRLTSNEINNSCLYGELQEVDYNEK